MDKIKTQQKKKKQTLWNENLYPRSRCSQSHQQEQEPKKKLSMVEVKESQYLQQMNHVSRKIVVIAML